MTTLRKMVHILIVLEQREVACSVVSVDGWSGSAAVEFAGEVFDNHSIRDLHHRHRRYIFRVERI
jgi:hypothetical protein